MLRVACRSLPVARGARSARGVRLAQPAMAAASTVFGEVPAAPADPILGITESFKACNAAYKLNLGVGAYRDDNLQPVVLEVVKKAEQRLLARELSGADNKEYLGMEGLAAFNRLSAQLLFGRDSEVLAQGRVATIQGLSGTGSLRLGAAFIAKFFPGRVVYISEPTWGNHKNILGDEGIEWRTYRYCPPGSVGLDFAGMVADLTAAPAGSVVLLHGCAHNPTGIDPTEAQWGELAALCASRQLLPFFDVAYQGFASGSLEKDAFAPRLFASRGLELLVAQSYSKNMGLYCERVGALSVLLADKAAVQPVLGQLKRIARAMYSNPPAHGARLVAEILGDAELSEAWTVELAAMAGRIHSVRVQLYEALCALNPSHNWRFVMDQIGMFSFTGLTPAQVENMTARHKIFMTKDGRISLAGLSSAKVPLVAAALDDSIKNH